MRKDVLFINPSSNVAVCTLWSKKEEILAKIDQRDLIHAIGTLYTEYGVNYVIETLAERPEINVLVVFGADLSSSGDALVDVFCGEVKRTVFGERARAVVESVRVVDLRDAYVKGDYGALNEAVKKYSGMPEKRRRVSLKVPEETVRSYPLPVAGISIFETSLFRAWVKALRNVLTYGYEKPSEYGEAQKELLNVMVTIGLYGRTYSLEKEFSKYFDITDFERHVREILTADKPDGVEYTYGERAIAHPTAGNQLENMIEKLCASPHTRRAVTVLWHHETDRDSAFPPCVDVYQGILSGKYYNHTVYIRSNDMVDAWPMNMYAHIKLAEHIVDEINRRTGKTYSVGTVTTVSCSAHIYAHSFQKAQEVAANNIDAFVPDPRGSFVIYHEGEKVCIEHRDTNHRILRKCVTDNIHDALRFVKEVYITPDHALYLGRELERAFRALKDGDTYEQDRA